MPSFANYLFSPTYHLNIAHYFLIFLFASSYPHTSKLSFGDALPSVKPCIDRRDGLSLPSNKISLILMGGFLLGLVKLAVNGKEFHTTTSPVTLKRLISKIHTHTLSFFDGEWEEMEKSSLGGEINPSLLSLKLLSHLDLSRNDFQGIPIPTFFGQLKSLRYLNLSYASFGGEIPAHLGNLSDLNYLDLSEESDYSSLELPSNSLNGLSNLSSLKYINLEGVDLSNIGVVEIGEIELKRARR